MIETIVMLAVILGNILFCILFSITQEMIREGMMSVLEIFLSLIALAFLVHTLKNAYRKIRRIMKMIIYLGID